MATKTTDQRRLLTLLSLIFCIARTEGFGLNHILFASPDFYLQCESISRSLPSILSSTFAHPAAHNQWNIETPTSFLAASSDASPNVLEIAWTVYRQELKSYPLKTKMLTGIFLSVVGDALAQSREPDKYNVKRAVSFATFDGCYRAVQQFTYPPMMELCSGKFSSTFLSSLGVAAASENTHLLASVEQTLVSQLVIIPTLYYPVFYAITGAVQGLTLEQTIQRAKDTFVSLMKRNLLFWIPVQFFAFNFVEENLQIPVLIVCGLVWTVILSVSAGAAAKVVVVEEEEVEKTEAAAAEILMK